MKKQFELKCKNCSEVYKTRQEIEELSGSDNICPVCGNKGIEIVEVN